ncbi:hypothetical_protein [Candidozyma auris]|uniref:hypothetical_protein n=1 Tax=Candidozyma auris TaxID=498019 RepID=UPI000D2E22D8|nr:hypothetical_protein [[Candida] auris]QEO19664.1 hypothetical_protein [[Candida] auris]GBL50353.1 hypothetical protein CAJCM15448_26270 [[Candida] auris]
MNALYNHGIKQTHHLTRDLASLEKNLSTSPMSLQGSIITSLTAFKKTIKEYNDMIQQTGGGDEKQRARLEKFNSELQQFQEKFDSLRQQRELLLQENDHQELMGRRHVAGASENPYEAESPRSGYTQSYHHQQQQQASMSYSEGLYKEKQSLSRGSQQLDQILEMGQNAFEDLVEQNETLRKLGSKFSESLVTLGVSQGTIRTIERRAKQNKWLFWGGVIILFVLFFFIIRWFH